jgi:hypothetical protein
MNAAARLRPGISAIRKHFSMRLLDTLKMWIILQSRRLSKEYLYPAHPDMRAENSAFRVDKEARR